MVLHEARRNGTILNHLELYNPGSEEFRKLTLPEGDIGAARLSGDGSMVAFAYSSTLQPRLYRPWLYDMNSGETKSLIHDTESRHHYAYPAWRFGMRQIAFLRLQRRDRGLHTELVLLGLDGSQPETILGDKEGAAAVCFSPDGARVAVLTRLGIEVFALSDGLRNLVAPWTAFDGRVYNGGGLTWSRTRDCLPSASRTLKPITGKSGPFH